MIARFGHPESSRLLNEFAEVFKGLTGTGGVLSQAPE
jgi:hypothetical protein